ncbi:MAG TPA: GNAT family N-acetyltransferase [Caulobacter sp.]|nr:GNAT family N-acetyltransferase [Caulobacter sp.]
MGLIDRTPRIETRRLTLRAPRPADAPVLAALLDDFDIARMTSSMPFPYGLADAETYLAHCAAADPRTDASFLIEHDDEGPIGGLGFDPSPEGGIEVGYWIGKPWWGRGFASEALVGAMTWAARDWRRRLVVAGHFRDNPASGRVLCRAGFLYTGRVELRHSRSRGEPVATRMMVWLA